MKLGHHFTDTHVVERIDIKNATKKKKEKTYSTKVDIRELEHRQGMNKIISIVLPMYMYLRGNYVLC
jgi:hypothetical protein